MKHARHPVTESVQKKRTIVFLPAVLDRRTVPGVRTELLELLVDKVNVQVDMSGVCRIDTAAIAVFVECVQAAKDHGTTFTVIQPTESASRLMRLTKLDRLLTGANADRKGVSHPEW